MEIEGHRFDSVREFRNTLRETMVPTEREESTILDTALIDVILISNIKLWQLDSKSLSDEQRSAMWQIVGRRFTHRWMVDEALANAAEAWKPKPATTVNKLFNRRLREQRRIIYDVFRIQDDGR